jgi:hypothetical protein
VRWKQGKRAAIAGRPLRLVDPTGIEPVTF